MLHLCSPRKPPPLVNIDPSFHTHRFNHIPSVGITNIQQTSRHVQIPRVSHDERPCREGACAAGADQGVDLVDHENDLLLGLEHLAARFCLLCWFSVVLPFDVVCDVCFVVLVVLLLVVCTSALALLPLSFFVFLSHAV